MKVLDHFLNLSACYEFNCILCSKHRKSIVLEILNDCKGISSFFDEDNIQSHLINLDNKITLDNRDIGELLESSLCKINFSDDYTLERLDFNKESKYYKEERFQLFLYILFLIGEDTEDGTNSNNIHYNFKLKGFKVENVISNWCSKYMQTNDTPVFLALKYFFRYGNSHYVRLSSKTRSRFLEKALRNLNKESKDVIKSALQDTIFMPLENDEQGIKRIYNELRLKVN